MSARSTGALRAMQSRLVLAARRSRWFPTTIPDRLGQDDELAGTRLAERVLVYFPDTAESLYQLEQWYRPLRALHERLPVVVVCQDSRTAARIRQDSGLRVLTIARYGRLDDLLARSDVRAVLYVNHSPRNFECLRFTEPVHLYLGHGDSDKGVSASNQVKAYDYCLVAGQEAVDRIAAHVHRYDAATRCLPIGQPQLDGTGLLPAADAPARPAPERPRVLYAPTWEGAQPSVAYSSVLTHGPALVRALLADGGLDVTYRPHPLTGVTSGAYAGADRDVRAALAAASSGSHRIDVGVPLAASFDDADVLVCDVSGVALSWLPSGRPLLLTKAQGEAVVEAGGPLASSVPRVAAADAPGVAALVHAALTGDGAGERRELAGRYFARLRDGEATAELVATITRLVGP
jgi:hypothetical protein